MKEILKHYVPPLRQDFDNGAAIVVDCNNHLLCFCENETIAQEIAAALNKVARLETLDELAEFSQEIGMYDCGEADLDNIKESEFQDGLRSLEMTMKSEVESE